MSIKYISNKSWWHGGKISASHRHLTSDREYIIYIYVHDDSVVYNVVYGRGIYHSFALRERYFSFSPFQRHNILLHANNITNNSVEFKSC